MRAPAVFGDSHQYHDRRINLRNVFVPHSARESATVRELPCELLRRLRQEGHITRGYDETARLREVYQSSPVSPILDVLTRNRLVVVLGDPGFGKTSLLKFLSMRWIPNDMPIVGQFTSSGQT
jgi:ABC-type uncharacterized transport system fused permease/ATPase subunit